MQQNRNQQSTQNISKSLRPSSRRVVKPEIHLNTNFKSLTNIPQLTTRIQEKQFQIKHSFNEINNETSIKRSNYHSILNEKKISLISNTDRDSDHNFRFKEFKLNNLDKSQPKGILKSINSKSKDHSNNDLNEIHENEEEKSILTKRIKFSSLKPIKNSFVQVSPDFIQKLSPKRVSFNTQVHIKVIEEKFQFKPKRYVLADLIDNI